MVGKVNFSLNLALKRLPIVRTHDVVDTHMKTIAMIGDTWSVPTLTEAVGEMSGDGMMDVGVGTIVEVSAEDDRQGLLGKIGRKSFGLWSPRH